MHLSDKLVIDSNIMGKFQHSTTDAFVCTGNRCAKIK